MLKVENSCEVGDLIDEVTEKSGKGFEEVESAFFKCHIYPESTKTFMCRNRDWQKNDKRQLVEEKGFKWLDKAMNKIFDECKIDEIYVTIAI